MRDETAIGYKSDEERLASLKSQGWTDLNVLSKELGQPPNKIRDEVGLILQSGTPDTYEAVNGNELIGLTTVATLRKKFSSSIVLEPRVIVKDVKFKEKKLKEIKDLPAAPKSMFPPQPQPAVKPPAQAKPEEIFLKEAVREENPRKSVRNQIREKQTKKYSKEIQAASDGHNNFTIEDLKSEEKAGQIRKILFRICRKLISGSPNPDVDAENLAQETFIRALERSAQFKGQINGSNASLITWLYRIAKNILIDYYRRTKKTGYLEDEEGRILFSDHGALNEAGLNSLISMEQYKRLLFKELSEKQKQIFTLKFEKELDDEEIAKLMEIPAGTVKSNINRIRKKWQKLIINSYQNNGGKHKNLNSQENGL